MHSIRRSCQSALQSSNATCPFANVSRRAFSRSAAHQRGALPVFLPASSPELTTLLWTANSRILLPLHLTSEQAKLVYRKENRAKIESEPIEITLGDVTLPLEHLNRNTDIPDRSKHLREIIAKSKTQADWENVLRVMEGYENAGIHMKRQWQTQIVRKLNQAGMQHLILKALQRASATGLRLRDWEVVKEVLRAVRDKAALADWGIEELKKALSMAEQVVELMEEDEHLGKAVAAADHRTNPMVVALPLEMAAELAYRHDGDIEKVKKYALRLMNALKQHDFLSSDIHKLNDLATRREQDYPRPIDQSRASGELAIEAYQKIPIWNGLSTARTVLDEEMPMPEDAERVQKELYAAIKAAEEGLHALGMRNGEPFIRAKDGFSNYVSESIKRCEDDGEM